MKVKLKLNNANLNGIRHIAEEALEDTAHAILSDVQDSETIPFDVGTLQNTSSSIDAENKKKGVVKIVFDTPYARRLYFHPEYKFKTDKNKNAGGLWMEPYIEGNKKEIPKRLFIKFMKKGLK